MILMVSCVISNLSALECAVAIECATHLGHVPGTFKIRSRVPILARVRLRQSCLAKISVFMRIRVWRLATSRGDGNPAEPIPIIGLRGPVAEAISLCSRPHGRNECRYALRTLGRGSCD